MAISIAAASPCFKKVTCFFYNHVVSAFPGPVFKAESHQTRLVFNTKKCLFTLPVVFEATFKDTCLKQAFHPLIKP